VNRIPRVLQRRQQPARWVFIVTSLPLILFGLMGAEHGALMLYAPLAAICLIQFFFPTVLGWGFVLLLYGAGSIVYIYTLGKDALKVVRSQQPEVFLNAYDSTFFLILVAVLVALTIVLVRNRPVLGSLTSGENHDVA
jgi:hypothetical protein